MRRVRRSFGIACLAVVAACSSTPSIPTSLGVPSTAHLAALSRGGASSATLELASGATSVDIVATASTSQLVAAATPATSSQRPTLALSTDHVVQLQLASSGSGRGPSVLSVELNPAVVWTIDLDGGATVERVDMSQGQVAMIALGAGTSRAVLNMPPARSTQVIRETGGVSDLTVAVPEAAATKVTVDGGASSATILGTAHTGVSGGTVYTDPAYPMASDRVNVELQGGVSSFLLRRS
jgi:hypothetical protein